MKNYGEYESRYIELWNKANVEGAIKVVEEAIELFPDHQNIISLDHARLYNTINETEKCIEILEEATDRGAWYPASFFRMIKDNERFDKIAARWEVMAKEAESEDTEKWRINVPEGYKEDKQYPVFIALHGWGEDLRLFAKYWKSEKMDKEYIVAMPQSSNRIGKYQFCWDSKALEEVEAIYVHLKENYNIDEDRIIVGGFSQGGDLTLDVMLNSKVIPARGFIALNPEKPEKFELEDIKNASGRKVRGIIITGEHDSCLDIQKEIKEIFDQYQLASQLQIIKDFGHWFPVDLSKRIDDGLDFILESK